MGDPVVGYLSGVVAVESTVLATLEVKRIARAAAWRGVIIAMARRIKGGRSC